MTDAWAIELRCAERTFGDVVAVRDLTLRVPRGQVYGFLGRNGAGKTTTIKLLAGLLRPSAGDVRVNGVAPAAFTVEDRRRIGYLSEKQSLPPNMKVRALISFCAPLYRDWDQDLVERTMKRFGVDSGQRVGALSMGTARMLGLALALAPRPRILLLDEPASGLDPVARREFLDEILDLVREVGPTVFFSSHLLGDVERIADRVGVLRDQTLLLDQSLDEAKDTIRQVRLYGFANDSAGVAVPGAFRQRNEGNEILALIRISGEADLDALTRRLGCRAEVRSLGLEDLFVELTRA